MQVLKNLFGKNAKIHVDEIATKVDGVKQLLGFAIISGWGSNENGSYIKFGNGFMICWVAYKQMTSAPNKAYGSLFRTDELVWTFPIMFSGHPVISSTVDSGVAYAMTSLGDKPTSKERMSVAVITATMSTYIPAVSLIAIGRWK